MDQVFDVAIIGGGINGCGAAADAALRGLSVVLLEKDDLASKTSSSSSKLIHGGLRYLEYYDFALVKKALNERQLLLSLAPHLVTPLSFVLPYQRNMRPTWLLRTGLFFYDNLSRKNELPHAKLIRRITQAAYFSPLIDSYNKGFLFYDCATDDARLTIANALQAKDEGALILRDTQLKEARVSNKLWHLAIQPKKSQQQVIKAKSVINAAGPWVESINEILHIPNQLKMSLVKGSHIVVHKLYEGNHAYLLQNDDQRIVFIVPYHGYTMIGTTDVAFNGSLDDVTISSEEIDYLCKIVNSYFNCHLVKNDIINTWSGVRPLIASDSEKLSSLSRDYICGYTEFPAPVVTIYGGKITTYRQASLDAVNQLHSVFPNLNDSKSAFKPLPGSTLNNWSYKEYVHHAREKYFWLDESLKERYLASYGTRTELLLEGCSKMSDLGQDFNHGLYQIEVDFLCREEWAKNCDDILWRRTKLGLDFNSEEKQLLAEYL
ncbi:glycerol-3-phosphate dehydrogenase [Legionella micdadei]|uniref:Glycerol-3-phosphate dehydrogenase n=1 Tax=Legionella micdadei TaxID=451 RepID=A0A098GGK1_LEGMI|nr:glycerol-3-phosphate dehydrogenase [Legionella micdadei]ARG97410.1 glycerol-3-phosphate dehydrogenase [Legionella micdadei]KTD28301.1 glycerol-3-phosphate dehydrogenase [Legionella micdadei]NSL16928.1 glycerol-3-phosphate dehydrogenase [Legionella micdadei]CEG61110.1 Glycerol-3-phosphate dehydrogenase [Legionella micdadei]SCY30463.1 homodimeric glycerol 3-phosphate dehydrogenase (quinone) [Legionella micdadei]